MHVIFLFMGYLLVEGHATPEGFRLTKVEKLSSTNPVTNGLVCQYTASLYGATYMPKGLPPEVKAGFIKEHSKLLKEVSQG